MNRALHGTVCCAANFAPLPSSGFTLCNIAVQPVVLAFVVQYMLSVLLLRAAIPRPRAVFQRGAIDPCIAHELCRKRELVFRDCRGKRYAFLCTS